MKHQASFAPRQKGCQNLQCSSGRKTWEDMHGFTSLCCCLVTQGNLFHVPWEIVNVKGPGSHLVRPVRGRQRQFLESMCHCTKIQGRCSHTILQGLPLLQFGMRCMSAADRYSQGICVHEWYQISRVFFWFLDVSWCFGCISRLSSKHDELMGA